VLSVNDLPAVNAGLNALSACLLVGGFAAIRRRNVALHRRIMLTAFTTSSLFLISYVTHKLLREGNAPFPGEGAIRVVYLTILVSHMILAAAIVPLATTLIVLGLRGRIERHKRLARFTWPAWLYVSVTGVVIWWMLYGGAFGPPPH
jgi:uncharacterized membrane protein YozB (DUF420 family)